MRPATVSAQVADERIASLTLRAGVGTLVPSISIT